MGEPAWVHAGGLEVSELLPRQARLPFCGSMGHLRRWVLATCRLKSTPISHQLSKLSTGRVQDWVLRTALDLALALEHLHTKCNIMHRDV
jgi:hypothetical protein